MSRTSILSDARLKVHQIHDLVYAWSDDLSLKQHVGIILEIDRYRFFSYLILIGDEKFWFCFDSLEKLDNIS